MPRHHSVVQPGVLFFALLHVFGLARESSPIGSPISPIAHRPSPIAHCPSPIAHGTLAFADSRQCLVMQLLGPKRSTRNYPSPPKLGSSSRGILGCLGGGRGGGREDLQAFMETAHPPPPHASPSPPSPAPLLCLPRFHECLKLVVGIDGDAEREHALGAVGWSRGWTAGTKGCRWDA